MKTIKGVPASSGLASGKAMLWTDGDVPEIPRYTIKKAEINAEWQRLQLVRKSLVEKLKNQIANLEKEKNKEQIDILKAHLLMLQDVDFLDQLKASLETNLLNIEWIVWSISHEMAQKLLGAADAYLRERAVDISDMSHELLVKLLSIQQVSLENLAENVILVARDIPPSQALSMDKTHIKGIVTESGSGTSHLAILARSFEIPMLVGCPNVCAEINSGDMLMVDGDSGAVFINPDKTKLEKQSAEDKKLQKKLSIIDEMRDLPAETTDGKRILVKINIEIPDEAENVQKYGADGIGLYRSEFLFLASGEAMDEERQYKAYRQALESCGKLPVTIRTMDVGGDKILPNFFSKDEKNPLLGWRAIRFSLAMPELFKAQMRAILRAAVYGNARIMFPLVSDIEELEKSLSLLQEAKAECRKAGLPIDEHIKAGTMIETPSAAITADILAKKSDFFSIGTNDLMQYTLAIDRGNERVSYLAKILHPALLRLIKQTIDAAHAAGIQATMCGEMASDPLATPVLIGLGLDIFSMNAACIPAIKQKIRSCNYEACQKIAAAALACDRAEAVEQLLKDGV